MKASGQIVTFYSYKGGTGRTMALVNVGWLLALAGKRVLLVDWDLEAPGLHKFLRPLLADADQTESEGLVDLVFTYSTAAARPLGENERPDSWYQDYADISEYVQPVLVDFPASGGLDFVSAGRQDAQYAKKVNTFDWTAFYSRFGGGGFLDAVFDKARQDYDFVLIDSRTGVSDTAGICTVQLPAVLVVLFTLSNQSIDGAAQVAADAIAQRARVDREPQKTIAPLSVVAVASRVDNAELRRATVARALVDEKFGRFQISDAPAKRLELPHVPYYGYEERLAVLEDSIDAPNTLLAGYRQLARRLVVGDLVFGSIERDEQGLRERLASRFERSAPGSNGKGSGTNAHPVGSSRDAAGAPREPVAQGAEPARDALAQVSASIARPEPAQPTTTVTVAAMVVAACVLAFATYLVVQSQNGGIAAAPSDGGVRPSVAADALADALPTVVATERVRGEIQEVASLRDDGRFENAVARAMDLFARVEAGPDGLAADLRRVAGTLVASSLADGAAGTVTALRAFGPRFVAGYASGIVRVIDVGGAVTMELPAGGAVVDIAADPETGTVVATTGTDIVRWTIVDSASTELRRALPAGTRTSALYAHGEYAVVVTADGRLRILSTREPFTTTGLRNDRAVTEPTARANERSSAMVFDTTGLVVATVHRGSPMLIDPGVYNSNDADLDEARLRLVTITTTSSRALVYDDRGVPQGVPVESGLVPPVGLRLLGLHLLFFDGISLMLRPRASTAVRYGRAARWVSPSGIGMRPAFASTQPSGHGYLVALAAEGGRAVVVEIQPDATPAAGTEIFTTLVDEPAPEGAPHIALTPAGDWLAASDGDRGVRLYYLGSGRRTTRPRIEINGELNRDAFIDAACAYVRLHPNPLAPTEICPPAAGAL